MHGSTLKITTATRAGSPHVACEDRVRTAPGLAVVVDGVTTVADGAEALGGTYIARSCRTEGPEAVLNLVEDADASDPSGHRRPRAEPGDDKALVHLRPAA